MKETYCLSDADINKIRQYIMSARTSLLQICYATNISYVTLDKILNKRGGARKSTLYKLKSYFAEKGVELEIDI